MSQKNMSAGAAAPPPRWNPEALRQEVSRLIDLELGPADDDVSLFELGLQSLQLMRLTNLLNRTGAQVEFMRLADDPRLSAWYELLRAAPVAESVTHGPHGTGATPASTRPTPFRSPPCSRRTGSAAPTAAPSEASAVTPTSRSTPAKSTRNGSSPPYVPCCNCTPCSGPVSTTTERSAYCPGPLGRA